MIQLFPEAVDNLHWWLIILTACEADPAKVPFDTYYACQAAENAGRLAERIFADGRVRR